MINNFLDKIIPQKASKDSKESELKVIKEPKELKKTKELAIEANTFIDKLRKAGF